MTASLTAPTHEGRAQPDQARADVIKVTATGGVLSASAAGLAQHYSSAELEAIVKTTHAMGEVAAHGDAPTASTPALAAGVDSIEHGTYLDNESITLFKSHKAYHVPTPLAGDTVTKNAEIPGYYLKMVADKARLAGPKMLDMFKRSHEAGVQIAFGTDTGVSPHGENAREFALMVKAGMTPAEAIHSATVVASTLLGLEKQIGTLEPRQSRDLIAVYHDPTQDVTHLERVVTVVKQGRRGGQEREVSGRPQGVRNARTTAFCHASGKADSFFLITSSETDSDVLRSTFRKLNAV